MGRIRTIKPEFPQSESIGRLSRDARLLFIQIWTLVDDLGRSRAASRVLASILYPYDTDAADLMDGWMAELEREGLVQRYEVDGAAYLQVCKWTLHQKIDHPSKSKFPPPPDVLASPREPSRKIALDQGLDQGPRTKDVEGRLDPREGSRATTAPADDQHDICAKPPAPLPPLPALPREPGLPDLQILGLIVTGADRERIDTLLCLYGGKACSEGVSTLMKTVEPFKGKRRVLVGMLADWLREEFTLEAADYVRAGMAIPPDLITDPPPIAAGATP